FTFAHPPCVQAFGLVNPVTFAGQDSEGAFGSTVVIACLLLLPGVGSRRVEFAVAVFEITVPWTVPALTTTTIWNVAVSPLATEALVKSTLRVPPTAGVVVVHPVPMVTIAETNVVLA